MHVLSTRLGVAGCLSTRCRAGLPLGTPRHSTNPLLRRHCECPRHISNQWTQSLSRNLYGPFGVQQKRLGEKVPHAQGCVTFFRVAFGVSTVFCRICKLCTGMLSPSLSCIALCAFSPVEVDQRQLAGVQLGAERLQRLFRDMEPHVSLPCHVPQVHSVSRLGTCCRLSISDEVLLMSRSVL